MGPQSIESSKPQNPGCFLLQHGIIVVAHSQCCNSHVYDSDLQTSLMLSVNPVLPSVLFCLSVFNTISRLNSFYCPVRLKLKIISETCLIKVTRRRDRPLTSQWNDFCFTFSDSNRSFCYLTLSGRLGAVSSRKRWGEAPFFFLSVREKSGLVLVFLQDLLSVLLAWFNTCGSTVMHTGLFSGSESSTSQ